MVVQNEFTSYLRKTLRAATPLIMVLGLAGLTVNPVHARPKYKVDNAHCACVCSTGFDSNIIEYPNPGACGALNGKTCNIEVDQGGVSVVRTGTLGNLRPSGY